MQLKHIPVEQIDDSQNIRDMEDISELAESIDRHGLLQPIVVRQDGDRYVIVAGHRRYAAIRRIGEATIAALVHDGMMDRDVPAARLIENIQRQQMRPLEIIAAVDAMKESNRLMSDRSISAQLGKTETWLHQIRKAAKAEQDLIEGGVPRETVAKLTRNDLYEASKHESYDDQADVATRLAEAPDGRKGQIRREAAKRRGATKVGSHRDDTG
jgi:ParB/RepB/Spo0J family partition protein